MSKVALTAALKVAVKYRCMYENADPDVGIGPFAETIVSDVLKEAYVQPHEVIVDTLIGVAKKHLR